MDLFRWGICCWQDASSVDLSSWHSASWTQLLLLIVQQQHCHLALFVSLCSSGPWWHFLCSFWEVLLVKTAKVNSKLLAVPQNTPGKFLHFPGTGKQFRRWLWLDFCLSVPYTLSCTTSLPVFGATGFTQSTAFSLLSLSSSLLSLLSSPLHWRTSSLLPKIMSGGGGTHLFSSLIAFVNKFLCLHFLLENNLIRIKGELSSNHPILVSTLLAYYLFYILLSTCWGREFKLY